MARSRGVAENVRTLVLCISRSLYKYYKEIIRAGASLSSAGRAGAGPYNDGMPSVAPPYSGLPPERVLDALKSVGVHGDGRLLALNSYENRVYQAWRDDAPPGGVKFYRPARWAGAHIAGGPAFGARPAGREFPGAAALQLGGRPLHEFGGFRFAVFARRGGRPPELEDPSVLEWIGRFLGRIHVVGAASAFRERPAPETARLRD